MNQAQQIHSKTAEQARENLLDQLVVACKKVNGHSIHALLALYADDVYYEDSYKALQGKNAFLDYCTEFLSQRVATVKVITSIQDADSFFISWSASLEPGSGVGEKSRVEGASYFKTRNGRIYFQRNYFDLGEFGTKMSKSRRPGWMRKKGSSRSGQ